MCLCLSQNCRPTRKNTKRSGGGFSRLLVIHGHTALSVFIVFTQRQVPRGTPPGRAKKPFHCSPTSKQFMHLLWSVANMPDSCCAIGCTNRRGGKPGLCFYRIPSDKENPERRRLWICAIIKRNVISVSGEGKQWQPSKYTRICSAHFIKGKQAQVKLGTSIYRYINYRIFSHKTHLYQRVSYLSLTQ